MPNNYYESLCTILEGNNKYPMIEGEQNVLDVVKMCAEATKMTENNSAALADATKKFEEVMNHCWKMLYLVPPHPLVDDSDKWVVVPQSSFIGSMFRTSPDTQVKVEMIERHADTVDGTPGCVYRINGNIKLAFMLYGNTIIEYETSNGEDMEMKNNYACACFITEFPFEVPYPSITTIIHAKVKDADGNDTVEDYGFISDVRNLTREEIDSEDLKNRFYSPKGTTLYPNMTHEEAEAMNYVDPEQPPEPTNDEPLLTVD